MSSKACLIGFGIVLGFAFALISSFAVTGLGFDSSSSELVPLVTAINKEVVREKSDKSNAFENDSFQTESAAAAAAKDAFVPTRRKRRNRDPPSPVVVPQATISRMNRFISMMHVPKTGGLAFYRQMARYVRFTHPSPGNDEKCYGHFAELYPNRPIMTIFREPRSHVLSMYYMCRFSGWGRGVTGNTNFPRGENGLEEWLDHFLSGSRNYFSCYHPYNMQFKYLQCDETHSTGQAAHGLPENLNTDWDRAVERLDSLAVIALTDRMLLSMCSLMRYFGANDCPEKITVKDPHGLPPHNVDELPPYILSKIDKLTEKDSILYKMAQEKFEAQLERFGLNSTE